MSKAVFPEKPAVRPLAGTDYVLEEDFYFPAKVVLYILHNDFCALFTNLKFFKFFSKNLLTKLRKYVIIKSRKEIKTELADVDSTLCISSKSSSVLGISTLVMLKEA